MVCTLPKSEPGLPEVPRIKPQDFERFQVFRETFLVSFTTVGDAEAFRTVGRLLFDMTVEFREYLPVVELPRRELRAALAELRHLEGYLGSYLGPEFPFAAEIAEQVRKVADCLDRGLRNRKKF